MDALKSTSPRPYASGVREIPALVTAGQHKEQDDARWATVVARDRTASGQFVYAVSTTGVYCRPGCASRLPRRENVAFFDTPTAARAAGYRPCARCRPDAAATDERIA